MKQPLRVALLGIAGLGAVIACSPAWAETFNASGTFAGLAGDLGGTLSIDTSTGAITSADLTVGQYVLNISSSTYSGPIRGIADTYDLVVYGQNYNYGVELVVPRTTLMGYNGSYLYSLDKPYDNIYASDFFGKYGNYSLQSGNLAASVSAAPEPSTWVLMFAGLGGVGLMLRRAKMTMGSRFRDAFSA